MQDRTQGQEAESISHMDNPGPSPDPCTSSGWRSVEVPWLRCTKWKRSSASAGWPGGRGLPVTLLLCSPASPAASTAAVFPTGPRVPGRWLQTLQLLPAGAHPPGVTAGSTCCLPAPTLSPAGTAAGAARAGHRSWASRQCHPPHRGDSSHCSRAQPHPISLQPASRCCRCPLHHLSLCPALSGSEQRGKKKLCLVTALLLLGHSTGATSS